LLKINAARNGFSSGKTQNLEFRIKQLKGLLRMVEENINEFHAAVYRDLCKNKWEGNWWKSLDITFFDVRILKLFAKPILIDNNFLANFYELDLLINVITNMIKDLKDHAQPHKLPFNLVAASEEAFIERIPYGVVLILGNILSLALMNIKHQIIGLLYEYSRNMESSGCNATLSIRGSIGRRKCYNS
jgi:hypothetical protein